MTTRADSASLSPTGVTPVVTVIVLSDYRPGEEKTWDDLRGALAALAGQDFDEPAEYLLLETAEDLKSMPEDVPGNLPGVRVISCDSCGSYSLKNAGINAARADLVACLDADCVPHPGWLRAAVDAMRRWPDAVAVSGRTTYPGRTTLEKALGLLSRCYVDRGQPGEVHLLSTNNMIVRRAVFQANPLPEDAGPLAYRIVTERLRRKGGKLYFQPTVLATHDFEGWSMERDLRRQVGWTSIRIRQIDGTLPGAGVIRTLGPASLPLFYAFRWVESAGSCLRLPKYFGLHWGHVPMLLGLAALVHSFELPGMLRALRSQSAGPTVYR